MLAPTRERRPTPLLVASQRLLKVDFDAAHEVARPFDEFLRDGTEQTWAIRNVAVEAVENRGEGLVAAHLRSLITTLIRWLKGVAAPRVLANCGAFPASRLAEPQLKSQLNSNLSGFRQPAKIGGALKC